MKKTVVITGAAKGIGFETARQLHEKGFDVVLTARDAAKGHAAAQQIGCRFVQLDVTDTQSITAATEILRHKVKQVDVLINNAAVLHRRDTLEQADYTLIEHTLMSNVAGPFMLVQALLPLMKNGSRIINISSGGGQLSTPAGGWSPVYCISKTAINGLTHQLATLLEPRDISVVAMDPGWVQTDMGGTSAPRTVQQGADTAVWLAADAPAELTDVFVRDRKVVEW
ncbi:MAG: SDR family NAD(P)-dependent oxidoreductase [Bacteroidia bacterium]|nr:SDR family NAD(P)-dependent oxidoreductase [Bacteroidia bacterium]